MTKSLLFLALLTTTTPALADNRAVIDKMLAIGDSKTKLERFAEVESPDFEMTMPFGSFKGPAAHAQMSKGFATAYPNYKHTITRCVESGEYISCEGIFAGDNKGPIAMPDGKTIPATGKHVEFGWIGYAHIKNGKIDQLHVMFDTAVMMTQLGLLPGK
jgi:predicted ester cyclase